MRIMVDTNILVSAALFPTSMTALALFQATREHTILICTYTLEELDRVFSRKFAHKKPALDAFLSKLAYELCYTPSVKDSTPDMRDEDDRPILQAAIDADANAILTGDKDFFALDFERLMIVSPNDFL